MRPKFLRVARKGSSRTTLYRKVQQAVAASGCFRYPTDECVHNAFSRLSEGGINQDFMLGKHLNFSLSRDKDTDKPIALVHTTASGSDLCQIVCEDITQFYVTLANEPSLAYFRIQEHIRKVTPSLSNERSKIVQVNSELQGCCFDVDYSISAVNSASRATPHLNRLNELLKSSLFTKLQLDYAKKYSTGFEVGVDLVSALASQQQPTMSTTSRKKIPAGSQLPSSSYSFGRNTSPTVEPVNSSPSTTLAGSSQLTGALLTTAIRQNLASINKRAEVTRSADFSGLNGSNLSTSLRNGKARSVVLNPSYSFSYGVSPDQSAETGVEAVELHDSTVT